MTNTIPEELGALLSYSLQVFDVSFNFLTGILPAWISVAPKYGALIKLDHNPFVCPIPQADLYTGATCVEYQITKIQPSCFQSYGIALIWGTPWPQHVNLWCAFSSVNLNPGSFLTTQALMINPECLSCDTPDLGNSYGPNNYLLNIFLNASNIGPMTQITNQSTVIPVLGSSGCPLDPPQNISMRLICSQNHLLKSMGNQTVKFSAFFALLFGLFFFT